MTEPKPAIQTVRGMHDVMPEKAALASRIEAKAREVFASFNYSEIRIPVLEYASLFERAVGEGTDIVEKEMFVLTDRGDRVLCMRPEGTAGVVRSYIENNLSQKYPLSKFFYIGPMFRAERPQAGRFREFTQIGSEYFGNAAPFADSETIAMLVFLFRELGIQEVEIKINSIGCPECRPRYQAALLEFLNSKRQDLCEDCQKRMVKNPLRALDCKTDRESLSKAPKSTEFLCEACQSNYNEVKADLRMFEVRFTEDPRLVRGLDYYSRTVFEVYPSSKAGSQDALAAGGRYDTLVEQLGGESTPAFGFAMGLERVMNLIEETAAIDQLEKNTSIFMIALGDEALQPSVRLMNNLRNELKGEKVSITGTFNAQSMKSQMRLANSLGARFCVIMGSNELQENSALVKDMKAQSQEKFEVSKISSHIRLKLAENNI